MVGSCWFHFRLKLCKTGRGGGGVAGLCWFQCRLRLCRAGVLAGFNVG